MADSGIVCGKCKVLLIEGKNDLSYLDNCFPVDLLTCPKCGQVLIPEELAKGKMLEVERMLEEK